MDFVAQVNSAHSPRAPAASTISTTATRRRALEGLPRFHRDDRSSISCFHNRGRWVGGGSPGRLDHPSLHHKHIHGNPEVDWRSPHFALLAPQLSVTN